MRRNQIEGLQSAILSPRYALGHRDIRGFNQITGNLFDYYLLTITSKLYVIPGGGYLTFESSGHYKLLLEYLKAIVRHFP